MNTQTLISGVSTTPTLLEKLIKAKAIRLESVQLARSVLELFHAVPPEIEAVFAVLLEAPTRGHTCQTPEEIAEYISRYLENDDMAFALRADDIRAALSDAHGLVSQWARGASRLGSTPIVEIAGKLYTHRYAAQELRTAKEFAQRVSQSSTNSGDVEELLNALPPYMHAAQRQAARHALEHPLTILTGGPGTGKTWTVRNILAAEIARALNQDREVPRIALAAPTGKAAARMVEALSSGLEAFTHEFGRKLVGNDEGRFAKLTISLASLEASTLHRLLGVSRPGARKTANPHKSIVPADIVVVDEVSMVDASMMTRLLDSLAPTTRLILIGDPHQLTSVEAGSVLADIVRLGKSNARVGSCIVHLTESRRFDAKNLVGRVVLDTRDGSISDQAAWNQVIREISDSEVIPDSVVGEFAERYLPMIHAAQRFRVEGETAAEEALRGLSNFQVLCTNRKGYRGVQTLNERILAHLQTKKTLRGTSIWTPGVPILILANDYGTKLYNGDIGVVVSPDHVAFPDDNGGVRLLHPSRLPKHQVSLAFTIHKSQGSEWDSVAVILPTSDSPLLTRELIYTGLSRAKSGVEVIGSRSILETGIRREAARATGLETLIETMLETGP